MSDPSNQPESKYQFAVFERIRQLNEKGHEVWSGRDLARVLGYSQWRNFKYAVDKAKIACEKSGNKPDEHIAESSTMIEIGRGARRKVEDVKLSRYACYLTVQNADPSKSIVALAQTYFAVQTRRQELSSQYRMLPEEQKRLYLRDEMSVQNRELAEVARQAGVETGEDFADFENRGYEGLYGGLNTEDIQERKRLANHQNILDYMGSEELADNIFRAAQTGAKLQREQVSDKDSANQTHNKVGQEVRKAIERLDGTMPEDLPTPKESIRELRRRELKRLKSQQ